MKIRRRNAPTISGFRPPVLKITQRVLVGSEKSSLYPILCASSRKTFPRVHDRYAPLGPKNYHVFITARSKSPKFGAMQCHCSIPNQGRFLKIDPEHRGIPERVWAGLIFCGDARMRLQFSFIASKYYFRRKTLLVSALTPLIEKVVVQREEMRSLSGRRSVTIHTRGDNVMALLLEGSDHLLTIKEVSVLTRLAVGTLYHLVSERRIPTVHLSRRCIRFRMSDLQRWIDEHAQEQIPEKTETRKKEGLHLPNL